MNYVMHPLSDCREGAVETDVKFCLIKFFDAVSFVRVLDQLMHGQCCIVRLNNRV